MEKKQQVRQYCQQFKTTGISTAFDNLLQEAETKQSGFLDFALSLLKAEADHRHRTEMAKRFKTAKLPRSNNLDQYDHALDNGIPKTRLNQLRELNWLDQIYNIMLMGPSGTGKTFIAAGLCADAIQNGYKAYFRSMEEITNMLTMKEFTKSALIDYKRLSNANLIVIDDIMMFPMEKKLAVSLFNFINQTYENTSFIITTNKMPTDWATLLDDEVLATALLDRLLFKCEVIQLSGKSYRLEHRKTIFKSDNI